MLLINYYKKHNITLSLALLLCTELSLRGIKNRLGIRRAWGQHKEKGNQNGPAADDLTAVEGIGNI
jgi:hypothetical protein